MGDDSLAEEKGMEDLAIKVNATTHAQDVKRNDSSGMLTKLDALLNQTEIYSEFLLEKMDGMALIAKEKDKGRGRRRGVKRKVDVIDAKMQQLSANNSALANGEGIKTAEGEDFVTEAERTAQEQEELIPLLTGGTLKSYQLKGVKWLISLWQNGLNGILADEMGLGKTIQTIGLLAHLKGKGMHGPFLVCAPLSTLSNWVSEIKRWAPTLPVLLYHGSKEERGEMRSNLPASTSPKFPILVTSFEVVMNDSRFLARHKWRHVVVDEGHRLKNFDCKLLRELKRIPMANTLLLTGTPLQNNLPELWSLLNFILPEIFASLQQFESWFDLSGKQNQGLNKEEEDEQHRRQVIAKLHKILRPFLLRRLKEEVEKGIPLKKEIIFYAQLTEYQQKFQNLLISRTLNEHFEVSNGGFKSRLNNVIMQLRKNANHPDLLVSHFDDSINYPPVDKMVGQCGKLKLLQRLLTHLRARGHKVLIFSQMTRMLDILEYYLQEHGMQPCRIDGQVKLVDRQKQIQEFNSDSQERFIFLLSTRAGGLGINLTAADTAIIYDSDWNPHMDLQAMARCHRIGQKKPVHIYRLITSQSVECRMLKVANSKKQLDHVVIEKGQFKQERQAPKTELDQDDLLALLRQGQDPEEEYFQNSEISDADLQRALDRTELDPHADALEPSVIFPTKGPGWEVVTTTAPSGTILSSITH